MPAADVLRGALSLWRGEPFAELSTGLAAAAETQRLSEVRLGAIEDLPRLERLVAENASRERLAGQLMLALYRSGRQTDALDTYRRIRTRLRDEQGLEPGPALRQIEQAILPQDAGIAMPAAVSTPRSHRRRVGRTAMFASAAALVAASRRCSVSARSQRQWPCRRTALRSSTRRADAWSQRCRSESGRSTS